MIIDREVFLKLSEMAKVPIAESEFDARKADFEKVLAFVQQIESVAIPDDFVAEPYATMQARPDIVVDSTDSERAAIVDNFPERDADNYLLVPKVLNK